MFISSAIILTVNLRSDRTSSLTRAVLSPVHVADGHPLRCSPSRRILPSENIFCQRKACAFDIASSPKACWSFPCVVVTLSPSLTQKEKMAYRCVMFHASFSWRGSQTPPDMSSTYSTLRHCTVMPLQVRIEEGWRSKAVRVSGLRYCQYSQEKISLITLLSDLVYMYVSFLSCGFYSPPSSCYFIALIGPNVKNNPWI